MIVANPLDPWGRQRKSRAAARALIRRTLDEHPDIDPEVHDLYKVAANLLYDEFRLMGHERPEPTAKRNGFTINESRRIWDRDDWTCRHCGGHSDLTVDHIHPKSKGGTDDDDNLQTLCRSCNSRKRDR